MAGHRKPGRPRSPRETRLGAQGRIVLPSAVRKAVDLRTGDRLIVLVEEEGILLLTPEQGIRRAQALAKALIRPGRDPVRELIEERRWEVRREKERHG